MRGGFGVVDPFQFDDGVHPTGDLTHFREAGASAGGVVRQLGSDIGEPFPRWVDITGKRALVVDGEREGRFRFGLGPPPLLGSGAELGSHPPASEPSHARLYPGGSSNPAMFTWSNLR